MSACSGPPLLAITSARLQVLPEYVIEFDPEDYIVIVIGQTIDRPGSRFQHANLAAAQPRAFSFKHYLANGRKRWTNKGGVELYFVVPKSQVFVVGKEGHSYPEIVIGGETIRLNVSGGGGTTWIDSIRRVSHACVNYPLKAMRAVAQAALTVAECRARGISLSIEPNDSWEARLIEEASARQQVREKLKQGMRLILTDDCQPRDVILESRHAHGVIGRDGHTRFRITNYQICWAKTAQQNAITITTPQQINHLPPNRTEPGGL